MKFFLSIILLFSLSQAEKYNSFFNEKQQKKEKKIEVNNQEIEHLFSKMHVLLGKDKEFTKKMIEKYGEDKDLKEGIIKYFHETKESTIRKFNASSGKQESIKVKLPNIVESLNYLKKSTKNGNLLAAFLGAKVITNSILLVDPKGKNSSREVKNIVNNNLPFFAQLLIRENLCYGYVLMTDYQYSSFKEYKKETYKKYMEKGFSVCKSQKSDIPNFLYKAIAEHKAIDIAEKKLKNRSKK